MYTRVLAVLGMILAVMASPAEAQWNVSMRSGNATAMATGASRQIQIGVTCQGNNQVVMLTLAESADLGNGNVEAQWDGGSIEQYALQDQNNVLSGSSSSPSVRAFLDNLQLRNAVRLWVTSAQDERVTDSISLSGSSRTIGSLSCNTSLSSPSRLTDAEIRQILIRESIGRYSGSCPCPYNVDRGGRRCGGRSAYSRPGGASPLCFARDVSDTVVESYRARTGR